MDYITPEDISALLVYFSKHSYQASQGSDSETKCPEIIGKCRQLFAMDYTFSIVENKGDLSKYYPSQIFILENSRWDNELETDEKWCDAEHLKDAFQHAKYARTRQRFPVPVIRYKKKNICRSSTLSSGPEMLVNHLLDKACGTVPETNWEERAHASQWNASDTYHQTFRGNDIRLLKTLDVLTIVDLMVEHKKQKYGVYVTSSEKADKNNRYKEFTILGLPYPGCEFFTEFRKKDYSGGNLIFNWSQSYIDAVLIIPKDRISARLHLPWESYKAWDLETLTLNYMKVILQYVEDSKSGMLIHCISGWDRTPLFISLLRLSLWADGAIHQTLDPLQILYLTIAYDWMLFGHSLEDRINKGEEIFYFCFYFLKQLARPELSVHNRPKSDSVSSQTSSADLDTQFEILNTSEVNSMGSNQSIHSSGSNKSQENKPCSAENNLELSGDLANGNSPVTSQLTAEQIEADIFSKIISKSRSSPVAVPTGNKLRERNDSSCSMGSWQLISAAGSLRGSASPSSPSLNEVNEDSGETGGDDENSTGTELFVSLYNGAASTDSSITLTSDNCFTMSSPEPDNASSRATKLAKVRELFINLYSQQIGLRYNQGEATSLLTFALPF